MGDDEAAALARSVPRNRLPPAVRADGSVYRVLVDIKSGDVPEAGLPLGTRVKVTRSGPDDLGSAPAVVEQVGPGEGTRVGPEAAAEGRVRRGVVKVWNQRLSKYKVQVRPSGEWGLGFGVLGLGVLGFGV